MLSKHFQIEIEGNLVFYLIEPMTEEHVYMNSFVDAQNETMTPTETGMFRFLSRAKSLERLARYFVLKVLLGFKKNCEIIW